MECLKKILLSLLVISTLFLNGCSKTQDDNVNFQQTAETLSIDEDGIYDQKDDVALYIVTFHKLPSNYMTKKEARKYGWEGGALSTVIEDKCIGGDEYGNYESILPEIDGTYYECDIDTLGKQKRGAKRIIYSDSYDIYYTDDHYESFTQLYVGEGD